MPEEPGASTEASPTSDAVTTEETPTSTPQLGAEGIQIPKGRFDEVNNKYQEIKGALEQYGGVDGIQKLAAAFNKTLPYYQKATQQEEAEEQAKTDAMDPWERELQGTNSELQKLRTEFASELKSRDEVLARNLAGLLSQSAAEAISGEDYTFLRDEKLATVFQRAVRSSEFMTTQDLSQGRAAVEAIANDLKAVFEAGRQSSWDQAKANQASDVSTGGMPFSGAPKELPDMPKDQHDMSFDKTIKDRMLAKAAAFVRKGLG